MKQLLLTRAVSITNQEILINPSYIVTARPANDQKHTVLALVNRPDSLEIQMHWTDFCNWLRTID